MTDLSQYTLPNDTGVCLLDCSTAFKNLTDKEKKYAHYIAQASWYGGLIVLVQVSLFELIIVMSIKTAAYNILNSIFKSFLENKF